MSFVIGVSNQQPKFDASAADVKATARGSLIHAISARDPFNRGELFQFRDWSEGKRQGIPAWTHRIRDGHDVLDAPGGFTKIQDEVSSNTMVAVIYLGQDTIDANITGFGSLTIPGTTISAIRYRGSASSGQHRSFYYNSVTSGYILHGDEGYVVVSASTKILPNGSCEVSISVNGEETPYYPLSTWDFNSWENLNYHIGGASSSPGMQDSSIADFYIFNEALAGTDYLQDLIRDLMTQYGILEPESAALLNRMVVKPQWTQQKNINTFIKSLKEGGVWNKLGFLHVFAQHDQQSALLDWTGNGFDGTMVNSLEFTPFVGFKGNETGHIDVVPGSMSAVPGYEQNNAHLCLWESANVAGNFYAMGTAIATGGIRAIITKRGGTSGGSLAVFRLNENIAPNPSVPSGDTSVGFFLVQRTIEEGQPLRRAYKDGTTPFDDNAATTGVPSNLRYFQTSVDVYAPDRVVSVGSAGAWLTPSEVSAYYNAMRDYATTLGLPGA